MSLPIQNGSLRDRREMHNANALKIGFFGANCSSARTATLVSERWLASWPDCLKLARMADEAGITLAAIARADGFEVFTHPGRIVPGMATQGIVHVVA